MTQTAALEAIVAAICGRSQMIEISTILQLSTPIIYYEWKRNSQVQLKPVPRNH